MTDWRRLDWLTDWRIIWLIDWQPDWLIDWSIVGRCGRFLELRNPHPTRREKVTKDFKIFEINVFLDSKFSDFGKLFPDQFNSWKFKGMSQNLSVKTYLKVKFFKTGVHCKLFRITPALGGRGGNDFCRSGGKTDKFEIKTSLILFTLENLFISSQNSYKKNVPNIFFGGRGINF